MTLFLNTRLKYERVSPFPSLSSRMLVSYKKQNNVKEAKAGKNIGGAIASRYRGSAANTQSGGGGSVHGGAELNSSIGHSYKKQTTLPIDSQCLI